MTDRLHRVDGVADGLALEAEAFAARDAVSRLWTARCRAIVCPAGLRRKPGFDEALRKSAARGWPVHLRPTGGGAVPQGPGILNLALAFTADRHFTIEKGYRVLTEIIRSAVPADLTVGAAPDSFCDGTWNLSIAGRKLVGTAQRLRPVGGGYRRVLAHALILVEGDIAAGARAVDAFHRDLGLPAIAIGAHTTLADAESPAAADPDRLTSALTNAATRTLRQVAGGKHAETQIPVAGGWHNSRKHIRGVLEGISPLYISQKGGFHRF